MQCGRGFRETLQEKLVGALADAAPFGGVVNPGGGGCDGSHGWSALATANRRD